MSKIYDTLTKKNIAISTALKRGIVTIPTRFIIPFKQVLIPSEDGKSKRMISTNDATVLFRQNKLKLHQIIGEYDVSSIASLDNKTNDDRIKKSIRTIKQNRMGIKRKKEIIQRKKNMFRYVLNYNDKKNFLKIIK
jgi:hypothetical protein